MNSKLINVKKRKGYTEYLDLDKLHKMVEIACEGLSGVSPSQVEMASGIQFYDGISTSEIQEILIKSAADLISLESPNYQFVAARLLLFSLRKSLYGLIQEHPSFYDHIQNCVNFGFYNPEILENYTKDELNQLGEYINHERDYIFTYAGLRQVVDKYLVQDRSTGKIYETPQFMYMMIAATGFANYPKNVRLRYVKRYYDAISKHKLNVPTPILAGIRTPLKQSASCVLLDCGDSLESIIATDGAMMRYIAGRAGIGLNIGRLRAMGSKIRGGEVVSTGVVPFLKKFEGSLKSCHQGGVRAAAATVYFPIWHKEIEDVIVLKNNKGTDENRVRKLDYNIQLSKIFYERFIQNGDITLFCPNDVPGLYDAFGLPEFDELYVKYENDNSVPKKVVKAQELFLSLLQERFETGRIYLMNIDHANSHGPFKDQVVMSNLCVAPETQILTKYGYQSIETLEDEFIEIWNGDSWSEVQVKKTSENQELIKVVINSEEIHCTEYHKFYVVENGQAYYRNGTCELKRAIELKPGDKLIKFDLPIIEGDMKLEDSYTLGFHTGDGSYSNGKPILDLYGDKKNVLGYLNYNSVNVNESQDRIRVYLNIPFNTKYFVPNANYNIDSRLEWLSGLIDSDGHIAKNGETESLQIASIHLNFLKELRLMLHTLGVDSKIKFMRDDSLRLLPDGKGGEKEYNCKKIWRILISNNGLVKLCNLGIKKFLKRKKINDSIPNRNAERFHLVEEVSYTGRRDATYCFTEPKKGLGMFNGYLTGNCTEIVEPTTPLESLDDENGEVALCTLSAFNVGLIKSDEELEELSELLVRFLDELIENQVYLVKAAEISTRNRRMLGVGVIGLAHYLAKLGVKYDQKEAWSAAHGLAESIQYYLLKASNNLAKEKGACAYFNKTKYSDGILPIDTYKKEVDIICNEPLQHDWEVLREDIKQYGLRNSTLSTIMPSASSSIISNATSSIEPPRGLISYKKSKKGPVKQIVPQYSTLKNNYTLLWNLKDNKSYFNIVAVFQKFFDHSISADWSYNPEYYPNKEIPTSVIVSDALYAYKFGHKTAYYSNIYDGRKDGMEDETETSSQQNLEIQKLIDEITQSEEEESCESCTV